MKLALERLPVAIETGRAKLEAELEIPENAKGIAVLPVAMPGGRRSDRILFIAAELEKKGIATLRCDLMTEDEGQIDARTAHFRFDVPFLAGRIAAVAEWAAHSRDTAGLPVACVASGTAGAAALLAAACDPAAFCSLVTLGGRSSLPGDALARVTAPTLLLVGAHDYFFITTNREAYRLLACEKLLEIVPDATHMFEEPGALEAAARLTADWVAGHLPLAMEARTEAGTLPAVH